MEVRAQAAPNPPISSTRFADFVVHGLATIRPWVRQSGPAGDRGNVAMELSRARLLGLLPVLVPRRP